MNLPQHLIHCRLQYRLPSHGSIAFSMHDAYSLPARQLRLMDKLPHFFRSFGAALPVQIQNGFNLKLSTVEILQSRFLDSCSDITQLRSKLDIDFFRRRNSRG